MRDPAWTEADRNAALVWASEQQFMCPGCGHDKRKSFDIDTDGRWVASMWVCHSCAARDRLLHRSGGRVEGAYVTSELVPDDE